MFNIRKRWEHARQQAAVRKLRLEPHIAKDVGLPPYHPDIHPRWPDI